MVLLAGVMALAACTAQDTASQVLLDAPATGPGQLPVFAAPGAWQIRYSWDCSAQRSQGNPAAGHFGFTVINEDDGSQAGLGGQVSKSGEKGHGLYGYRLPGQYHLVVDTVCKYEVKVLKA